MPAPTATSGTVRPDPGGTPQGAGYPPPPAGYPQGAGYPPPAQTYVVTVPQGRYAEVNGFEVRPARIRLEPEESSCCRWSVRFDPFDLLTRRVTMAAEIALGRLPFSVEVTPKYIFDSASDSLDEKGFDVGGRLAWYPGGSALRGLWVKAHVEYENFRSTLTREGIGGPLGKPDPNLCDADSAPGTCSRRVSSTIVGLLVGSTQVFGANGGFAVSGGIGIGAALAGATDLAVLPCTKTDVADGNPSCAAAEGPGASGLSFRYYDDASRVRLLGSMSLGVVF